MKRLNSIFVLLALMLSLGVLVSSIAPYLASSATATLCETEEDCLEESLDELLVEQFDFSEDLLLVAWCFLDTGQRFAITQQVSAFSKISASFCSFGWLLPLRI